MTWEQLAAVVSIKNSQGKLSATVDEDKIQQTAVAAGNDSGNACSYSPARTPNALTVGSTTSSDARSSFSNYGTCVDIFGPGSSITSASYSSDTSSTETSPPAASGSSRPVAGSAR